MCFLITSFYGNPLSHCLIVENVSMPTDIIFVGKVLLLVEAVEGKQQIQNMFHSVDKASEGNE